MSLPSKVNKENFRLLDLSSDEESEDLHLEIIPNRKKKITRRDRNRGGPIKAQEPNIGTEVRCALRWAVRGTLILWLLMLTWICAALYDQVSVMRIEIDKGKTYLFLFWYLHSQSKCIYSENKSHSIHLNTHLTGYRLGNS